MQTGVAAPELARTAVVAGTSSSSFAVARYEMPQGMEQRLYAIQDANFNVTALADVYGNVVERYRYSAYGKRTVLEADFTADGDNTPDWLIRHGFQGLSFDVNSLNWHARNRELDPDLGRWTQMDPAGYVDGMSLFQFVNSGPASSLDPMGLQALSDNELTSARRDVQNYLK